MRFHRRSLGSVLGVGAFAVTALAAPPPSCSSASLALTAQATACIDRDDFSCAKSAAAQVLEDQPDCAQGLYVQSLISDHEGRSDEAKLLRVRAQTLDPKLRTLVDKQKDVLVNVGFDGHHDAFYQEQFSDLIYRAKRIMPRAYAHILDVWGFHYPGLLHPLTVQAKEVSSDTLRRWTIAYVQPVGEDGEFHQFLVMDIGFFIQNPRMNYELVITHEMAHVIIGDLVAGPHAAAIPSWLNEGYAQSVTEEGQQRVRAEIAESKATGIPPLPCDLTAPVDEFAHGPFNARCYSEYYLAARRLDQLGGAHTLTRILAGLHDGKEPAELILNITGMDWPTFKENAETYATSVLNGAAPIP